ncbi:MAG: acetyl-CoA carboxylase biotin carboxyl carrier protein [Longimicrobiales bacterium]|jgi:acetyl-CoA carboxylase biotin carboxyl carrier protein
MIDLDFLDRLIKALDDSSVDSLEIERGGTRVHLSKTPLHAAVPMAAPAMMHAPVAAALPAPEAAQPAGGDAAPAGPSNPNLLDVTSPMVGTFYLAPAPDAPDYVEVGTRVKKGDTLCIIEAMKLMNEFECEIEGTVVELCVENAQPVEYGQVLFRVDPA